MKIYFKNSDQVSLDMGERLREAAVRTVDLDFLDEQMCAVSVSFVSREEIRQLNKEYRGIDKVTDVLSFPQYDTNDELCAALELFGRADLGDVVICMDKCREQAEEYGHSYEREVVYLFVHSMLHLLGYDHEDPEEKEKMREREEVIMAGLQLPR
ncbi:MAG: rRNA maturation RNase YbeY [Anaerovoracaceae bacterium]